MYLIGVVFWGFFFHIFYEEIYCNFQTYLDFAHTSHKVLYF